METYSVPSPIDKACNSMSFYYELPDRNGGFDKSFKSYGISKTQFAPSVWSAVCTMWLYGMRVSEVINLTLDDYIGSNRLLVKGLKKSNSYIIFLPELDHWIQCYSIKNKDRRIFNVTYSKIYRALKKAGVSEKKTGGINCSVSHLQRFDLADRVVKIGGENAVTSALHHKSQSSALFYINKRRP